MLPKNAFREWIRTVSALSAVWALTFVALPSLVHCAPQDGGQHQESCSLSTVSAPAPDFPKADREVPIKTPIVELWVGEDGKVKKARLLRSTNVKSWDRAILKTLKRWEFSPAPGCGTRKTKVTVDIHPS